jgi:MoaA/NifB/PqqE/SkfB family radical SAM enzyme
MDFIWNISLVCPWDCEFCCTDAVHVRRNADEIVLKEAGLSENRVISIGKYIPMHLRILDMAPNAYDYALLDRQQRGLELNFEEKIKVLENIYDKKPDIDFAGGDPLACLENYLVIKRAREMFGKTHISVTSTGHSLSRYSMNDIAENIGTFEFTYDESDMEEAKYRPNGYNSINVLWAKRIALFGVKTKCQIPIHQNNISSKNIRAIYCRLAEAGIDEILIMRTFPVGRGAKFLNSGIKKLNALDYHLVISAYRMLEQEIKGPKIKVQCALKNLFPKENHSNPCDLMHSSFGINSKGQLLLSAWATNPLGLPLSEDFLLGDLSKESMCNIEYSEKFLRYKKRLDENYGHCKIFSYVHSQEKSSNSIFVQGDPLYKNNYEKD